MFLVILFCYSGFADAYVNNKLKKNILLVKNVNHSKRLYLQKNSNITSFNKHVYNDSLSKNFNTKPLIIGAEFLMGCVGELIPITFFILAQSSYGRGNNHEIDVLYISSLVSSPIIGGFLTWSTGKFSDENPSFLKTELGALGGMGIVGIAFIIFEPEEDNALNWFFLIPIPLGATIGANL